MTHGSLRSTVPAASWRTNPQADSALLASRRRVIARHAPDTPTEERTIRWSEGRTHVLEAGKGPDALLIHGEPGQSTEWTPILPVLASQLRVHAIDGAGDGLADPFDYRGTDPRHHAVSFVGDALNALGLKRAILVGQSMGGRYAAEFALRQPHRIERLVLVGAPAGIIQHVPKAIYDLLKLFGLMSNPVLGPLVRFQMAKPAALARIRNEFGAVVAHPERLTDEFLEADRWNLLRNYRSMRSLFLSAGDKRGLREPFLLRGRWKSLTVPTTFVWGEKDIFAPADAGRQAASEAAEGQFVLVPDAGHIPWIDDPDRVARAILAGALPDDGT